MAEFFLERMNYMVNEILKENESLSSEMAIRILRKLEVTLNEYQPMTASRDFGDTIRNLENESAARLWLEDLEEMTYQMEDVVGKWRLVISNTRSSQGKFVRFTQFCMPVISWNGVIDHISTMERQLKVLLLNGRELVVEDMEKSKRCERSRNRDDQGFMVSSVREGDKNRVLEHVLSPENGGKVISIVGFGGSGKTSLARSLYNHHNVEAYFQFQAWVHVEADILDERNMAKQLLRSFRIPYEKGTRLELLLQLLEHSFSGKNVLLVLDDFWAAQDSKIWESFNKLFPNSEVGSRILVTTRSEGLGIVHTLAPLSTKDCLLILKSAAGVESLHRISRKDLAKRCEGSPLVAKKLGMKLRSKDTVEAWQQVLNDGIMEEEVCMVRFRQFYNSYDKLPPYMKSCLLYTAILFPKSTVLDSEKLIRLWMSQGYLGYPPAVLHYHDNYARFMGYRDVENKGTRCLSRLIGLCFFQRITSHSVHKPVSCKMPDVAHRCGLSDRKGRSFIISPEIKVNPGLFGRLRRMTALVLSSCQLDQLPDEVQLLSRLQYLDLSDNPLKRLPPAICELYYLEFLDVQFCYLLSSLPRNIGKLSKLRHLRINHTTEELHDLPPGFENLSLMQTLDVFRVGGTMYQDALKKVKNLIHLVDICIVVHGKVHFPDAELECTTHLVNLELCFVGEGRDQDMVGSIEDLRPPSSLEMLKFEHYPRLTLPNWILAEHAIKNLKRLSLRSAANISSLPALWRLSSLEFLWLYDIPKMKTLGCEFFGLPSTQQQHYSPENQQTKSQHMSEDDDDDDEEEEEEEIDDYSDDYRETTVDEPCDHSEANHGEITNDDAAQDAEREKAAAFCSLRTLRIEYLENWEIWEDANEADEFNIKVMPSLEELIIAHCPKLQGRPLCILKDTPWFRDSYPREVKHDKRKNQKIIMTPPSPKECSSTAHNQNKGINVALKASYMKLKMFVHDAHVSKVPAQHLKVLIPEGVLGKTGVTSYLPLDYLYEWFEKDRSIFAEQLCVWSMFIYELMTPADKERVQMASSALITTVGRQGKSGMIAEDLVDFMIDNKAKLYLVPFLRPGHWELLATVPETEVIYWFDSLQGNISLELSELLNMVERKYVTRNLNSTIEHDSWKVVDIKHKRQADSWESGYYVMIWMHKIGLEIQDLNLESHFPTDKSSYELDKLREVDWKWCARVMPEFPA